MKLNIANKLTVGRIILTFFIMFLLLFSFSEVNIIFPKYLVEGVYIDSKYVVAGILFIIAAITDILDGRIARKRGIVTNLGTMLDDIADKILINSMLVLLSSYGFIHPAIAVIIIMRDAFTSTIKMASGEKLETVKSDKFKNMFITIGIALTLFYNMPFEIWGLDIANFCLVTGTVLSIISAIEYFNLNKKYINQN